MSAAGRVGRSRPGPVRPVSIKTEGSQTVAVEGSSFGVSQDERVPLEVEPFVTEPAYVRVSAGVTKNLGNYESFRCDVSITMPCYPEEVETVKERVSDAVARILEEEMVKYQIHPDGQGS